MKNICIYLLTKFFDYRQNEKLKEKQKHTDIKKLYLYNILIVIYLIIYTNYK